MFNKTKLLSLGIVLFALVGVSFANYGSTTDSYQPAVHNNNLNFQASYDNGVVNMTWNKFVPASSNRHYYKVVRSLNKTTPVYPDDGYIKAIRDQGTTSHVDTNPLAGTVYYGVCAITENSYGKYRNCDWQSVTVDGTTTTVEPVVTSAPVPTTYNLSNSLKVAVDAMMEKLLNNLEDKFGDDRNSKISLLETLSDKLDGIKVNYRLKPMITYLVEKIDEAIALLQIESLLDID